MANKQGFPSDLLNSLIEAAEQKVISKGDFLLREGETERNLYFIKTGAIRIFYLTEYEEHTIRFGYDGSFINSLSSFIKGQPSEFYIQAIRKTTLLVISKQKLWEIINESDDRLKQYCTLLETAITQQIDREIDILITSPSERLKRVLERSPDLFQHIPLKYIASYLRMKPETLSRIRNS